MLYKKQHMMYEEQNIILDDVLFESIVTANILISYANFAYFVQSGQFYYSITKPYLRSLLKKKKIIKRKSIKSTFNFMQTIYAMDNIFFDIIYSSVKKNLKRSNIVYIPYVVIC